MTKEEVEVKMQELVAKWQGKPEAGKNTPEYWRRRVDRLRYHYLEELLVKTTPLPESYPPKESTEIKTTDQLVVFAHEIFDAPRESTIDNSLKE